jgi:predicted metal-dependent phosphoesterase TrpH
VHSCGSRQSGTLRFLRSRDCYSSPDAVYRTAKRRGMDLVTITDHDSIDGCLEFLSRHPDAGDFFVSEEVSCRFPGSTLEVHLGVYGQTERLHRELQPLRGNVFDVAAALREAGVLFSLNHLLHFYRGQVPLEGYLRLLGEVPALETRNGTMRADHNALVAALARPAAAGGTGGRAHRPVAVGGSDAHTLRRVGRTWTEAPGTTAAGFLASVAAGRGRVGGAHGTFWCITADAYGVIARYVASLLGYGPRDHALARRAACLLFSAGSLPAQVLPPIVAALGKAAERREVRRAAEYLARVRDETGAAIAAGRAEA